MQAAVATFPEVIIPNSEGFQSVLRDGKYGCLFDNFKTPKTLSIRDFETNRAIHSLNCDLGESFASFAFPYIVTRLDDQLKIWNLESPSQPTIINTALKDITRVEIHGKTLVILSTESETTSPRHVTVYKDFEKVGRTQFKDDDIDVNSCLKVTDNHLIYSVKYGTLRRVRLDGHNKKTLYSTSLPKGTGNITEYAIHSLLGDKKLYVAASEKAIKAWGKYDSKKVKISIPLDQKFTLLNLQGPHILGFNEREIRIWDIFTGAIVHTEVNNKASDLPSFTLHDHKIHRINSDTNKPPETSTGWFSSITSSTPSSIVTKPKVTLLRPNLQTLRSKVGPTQVAGPSTFTSRDFKLFLAGILLIISVIFFKTIPIKFS